MRTTHTSSWVLALALMTTAPTWAEDNLGTPDDIETPKVIGQKVDDDLPGTIEDVKSIKSAQKEEQTKENAAGARLLSSLAFTLAYGGETWEGARPLYVFIDPRCGYCHKFIRQAIKQEATFRKHKVQPVFVPVSFLGDKSAYDADVYVKGGWDALRQHAEKNILQRDKAAMSQEAKANTEAWIDFAKALGMHSIGTPFFILRDADGDIHHFSGVPEAKTLKLMFELLDY